MYIKEIQIDSLTPTGDKVEKNTQKSLAEAGSNILPPIRVICHPRKDGFYFIYDGHNRAYFAAANGQNTITAQVLETIEDIVESGGPYFQMKDYRLDIEQEGLLRTERELIAKRIIHILDLEVAEMDDQAG